MDQDYFHLDIMLTIQVRFFHLSSILNTGQISVQVYELTQGQVYQEFYSGLDLTGTQLNTNEANYLSFTDSTSGFYGSGKDDLSGKLIAWVIFKEAGNKNLKYGCDDGCTIEINDQNYANEFTHNGVKNGTLTTSVNLNIWYCLVNIERIKTIFS